MDGFVCNDVVELIRMMRKFLYDGLGEYAGLSFFLEEAVLSSRARPHL